MLDNTKNNFIYSPLLASEEINGGSQSRQEFNEVWSQFDNLTEDKKNVLGSALMIEKIEELQEQFKISDANIEAISVYIRWFYFKEQPQEEFRESVEALLAEYPEEIKKSTVEFIEKKIFTLQPLVVVPDSTEKQSAKQTVNLQILTALSKYPNLGNQNITTERIRIKSQPEPVRGSLYNWIKCYRDELGIGQHSTVERGQFLFRSENGKRLTPEERERINLILKSIEENYALDIDPEKQIIVFPEMHFEKALAGVPVGAPAVPIKEMFGTRNTEEEMKAPTPNAFFAPRPETEAQPVPQVVVNSFQSGNATVERSAINSILAERQASLVTHDFSREAEKLKREPKPEWIKGAFTKESIPEKVKPEPVNGTMSFSLNHVLPVEQEIKKEEVMKVAPDTQSQVRVLEKQTPVAPASAGSVVPQAPARHNQFHIRPVNRNDF